MKRLQKDLHSLQKQGRAEPASVQQTLQKAINNALLSFMPPERLTVSEWADKNRIFSSEETSRPGQWDTNAVPYMRFIMDCFNDDLIQEINFLKCTQIAGTEALLNIVGYVVDQDPGRIVYVLPDDKLCREFSDMRAQKMLTNCPVLAEKFDATGSKDTLLKFRGGFLLFGSAHSPAALASWSARVIVLDEIDKYPKWAGREASPIKLVVERAKNWWNRKIFKISTPTLKTGAIYQAYEKSDLKYEYQMPCPHCGHEQIFDFKNIRWPKREDGSYEISAVYYSSYYECPRCRGRIDDRHKPAMLRAGKWVQNNEFEGRARSVGFHINSIYSPWLTFGQVAAEFLNSKDDPEDLMNFVNSWLGEPWENKAATLDSEIVLEKQSDLPECVVPDWAQLLTGGVDVQQNRMYWTIRAWGAHITSQNIAHGMAESWDDIEQIMNRRWPDINGELRWRVNLCGVDSGYDTENVYDFCLVNQEWAVPVKGSSNPMLARYKKSVIDKPDSKSYGQILYVVDTDQYKNLIDSRLRRPLGKGCFMVHCDCDKDYAEQLTSEHKIKENKNGKEVLTWVPKTSHAQNHYLDTEVYAALAADLLQMRWLEDLPVDEPSPIVAPEKEEEWIKEREWFD